MVSLAPAAKPPPSLRRYRAAVASRTVAAVAGGYLLAAAGAAVGATLLAFIVHAVAAMWAFGCASAWRAWAGVCLPGVVLALAAWWLQRGGTA
jgi:hypothetical protein